MLLGEREMICHLCSAKNLEGGNICKNVVSAW